MFQKLKFIAGLHYHAETALYHVQMCVSTSRHDREMILANRSVIADEVACFLQISYGSSYEIIHDKTVSLKSLLFLGAHWQRSDHVWSVTEQRKMEQLRSTNNISERVPHCNMRAQKAVRPT